MTADEQDEFWPLDDDEVRGGQVLADETAKPDTSREPPPPPPPPQRND